MLGFERAKRTQGWEEAMAMAMANPMAPYTGRPLTPSPVLWRVASRAPWCRPWTSSRFASRSSSSSGVLKKECEVFSDVETMDTAFQRLVGDGSD